MPSPTAARDPLPVRPDTRAEASAKRKVIAVVGVNAPGLGLVGAICEDPQGEFSARAIVDEAGLSSGDSRSLAELGADVRKGHARDEASLRAAFAGAYGAFYMQLSSGYALADAGQATAQAVARAAKDAGVRHVIWATLEDPGQALLEHDDLTPTFVGGRWISDEESQESVEEIFGRFGVPVTFLQISWDPSVAAGSWTEDIGRYAYTLLRGVDTIGKTVAISAARLIHGLPPGLPPGLAPLPTPAPPAARAIAPPRPVRAPAPHSLLAKSPRKSPQSRARNIGIAGAILAGGLVGLLIARQVGRQILSPLPAHTGGATVAQAPRPAPAIESIVAAGPAPSAPAAPAEAPAAPAIVAGQGGPGRAPAPAAAAPADSTSVAHAPGRRVAVLKPRQPDTRRPTVASPAVTSAAGGAAPASEKPAAPAAASPAEATRGSAPHPSPAAKPVVASTATTAQPPAAATPSASSPLPAEPRPGYVDPRAVSATVHSHAAEARACYDRAIMEHPDLHGRLTLRATIDPAGRVVSLTPTSDIAEGGRLQTCLVSAFKSWTFPSPAGAVNGSISYAFAFDSEIAR